LGVFSALWSLFLWAQLVLARSGGTTFCAAGEDAGCAAVWDSPFAAAIHRFTGLPLAGWGLVWGVAAFVFPLLSLLRVAERRPASNLIWAGRWMAVLGVVVVSLMILVSAAERSFCSGCAIIYALVIWYAGVTVTTWQQMSLREARRGLALAMVANGVIFLLLLYPGLKTPRNLTTVTGKEVLADHSGRDTLSRSGTGDPERDRQITELIASLTPESQQTLSNSLYIYRRSPELKLPPPRVLLGSTKGAPVRITEFTDVLCSQCARLHKTLESLRERLPRGSFSIEPRQYPLDTGCNPRARVSHWRSARCLAAAAQICLERHEKAFEFSSALFENQASLSDEKIYELAAPYLPQPDLERCVRSAATQAKLADDLALAYRYYAKGVPLVLVNGRQGTSFGPFLNAMVLTRGAAFHPAFKALPEPNPRVDLR
jgi:serine/threonine-protein kinase